MLFLIADAQDPCTAHLTLSDVTMTTDYTQGPLDSLRYGDFIDNFKWYRYTGTPQGILASSSPKGTQCLSENQVWSNGKLVDDTLAASIENKSSEFPTRSNTKLAVQPQKMVRGVKFGFNKLMD